MLMVHMQQTAYKTGLGSKPLRLSTHSIIKSTVSTSNSSSISVLLEVVNRTHAASAELSTLRS